MADTLRDRIAAAVAQSLFAQATWQGKVDNWFVADAVIETLNIHDDEIYAARKECGYE